MEEKSFEIYSATAIMIFGFVKSPQIDNLHF